MNKRELKNVFLMPIFFYIYIFTKNIFIFLGQYVMVVGEVLAVKPNIKIKPVKLTHLVDPNAEILWMLEILDFWKFLETT